MTPRPKASEREQANAKKAKHQRKKGLESYFGMGERVGPPSLSGTPTDAAGKRRGEGHKEGNDTRSRKQKGGYIHTTRGLKVTRGQKVDTRTGEVFKRPRPEGIRIHEKGRRKIRRGTAQEQLGRLPKNPFQKGWMTSTLEGARRHNPMMTHHLLKSSETVNQLIWSR